ncbi:MAG: NUDIX domain-containing protein [Candidatus Nomurabacteria bacterium]|nr:MAG: NUDIX domain-containing protein [Candidatus Nomurabacteria bacterium]
MQHELLDIINEEDEVIGQATRQELYDKGLTCRIVHVFVQNSQGQFAIQKRSEVVSFLPGHWSSSASGHVKKGESYDEAAARELQEELGIEAPLENALTTWYTVPDRNIRRRIGVYLAKHEGPFELEAIEVAEVVWHEPEEVLAMAKKGEPFQPELAIRKSYSPYRKSIWSLHCFIARNCQKAGEPQLDGGEK